MARTRTTPAASGKPRNKRQSGYVVTIRGFIPAGDTIADKRAVLDALEAIEAGDATAALAILTGTTIDHKLTTRTVPVPADAGGQ